MELMRQRLGMEKNFFELCQQVVRSLDLELYDLEYLPGSGELRVYITGTKEPRVKIEDCVRVDQALTPFIDTLEWMPSKLTLEVSSPGLYRKLRELEHFQNAIGETVSLELSKEVVVSQGKEKAASKNLKNLKKLRGKLKACKDETIEVEWQGNSKNGSKNDSINIEIPFANIKKANLDPDFNELISQEVKP